MTSLRYLVLSTAIWCLACPWLLWPSFVPPLTVFFLILLLGLRLSARRWQGRFLRSTAVSPFLFFYLLSAAVGYLISPAPALGLPKLTTLALGAFGYYLALDWLNRGDERIWTLLHLLLATAGGMIALITPFIILWPSRQIVDLDVLAARMPHLTGDFSVHSNEIGGTLLFLLPFAVVLSFQRGRHRRKWRILSGLLIVLVLGGLFLAQSRSALLGMVLSAVAALTWSRLRVAPVALSLIAVFILGAGVAAMAGIDGADVTRWIGRVDVQTKSGPDRVTSWAMRREIWRAGWSMLGDYPLFGTGLYAFVPVTKANYPYEAVPPDYSVTHAHNLFLQTGATLGWPALLALLGLWATVLQGLWQEGTVRSQRRAVYGASLVGYLAFNSFDVITLGQRPGVLMWVILAGAVVAGGNVHASIAPWKQLAPLLLGVGLVLTPLLSRNVANWRLDQIRVAGKVERNLSDDAYLGDRRRQGLVSILQGDVDQALDHWRRDPHGAIFLQSQGLQRAAVADYEAAIAWYDMALGLKRRRATVYYWRGMAQLQMGAIQNAQTDFQRAAHFAPQDGLDEWWQARILFYKARSQMGYGDWQGAVETLRRAISLHDTADHYQLLGDALLMSGEEEAAAAAREMAKQKLRQ